MIDSNLAMMVCGAGVTFFLIHSERAAPIRWVLFKFEYFERMFACPFCTGYWVGLFTAMFYWYMQFGIEGMTLERGVWAMADVIMMGMGTGILAIVLDRLIDLGDASVQGVVLAQSVLSDELEVVYAENLNEDEEPTDPSIDPGVVGSES